jgi:hypothetical protein
MKAKSSKEIEYERQRFRNILKNRRKITVDYGHYDIGYEQGKKDAYKKTLKFVKMYSQNDDVSEIDLIPIMDWLVELSKDE